MVFRIGFKIWHFFSKLTIPLPGGQSLDEPITYVSLTFSLLTLDFGHNSTDSGDGSPGHLRSGVCVCFTSGTTIHHLD